MYKILYRLMSHEQTVKVCGPLTWSEKGLTAFDGFKSGLNAPRFYA